MVVYTLATTVFQSNGHWDCTVSVHPELEALHAEYQVTRGKESIT